MGKRKNNLNIKDLKEKYNVSDVYSYSKLTTFENDLYGYFLKYIQYIKEDRPTSCYSILGSETHDLIQKAYEDDLSIEDMIQIFSNKLTECNLLENKFASGDSELDQKIEKRYEPQIKHYLKNFKRIECEEYSIEEPMYANIEGNVVYGYVDIWFKQKIKGEEGTGKDDDFIIYIQDFKTSSMYKKDKIESAKNQLLLYALFLHDKYNIPFDKIKIRWDFIKYAKCTYTQKNGMIKIQYIERDELDEWVLNKNLKNIVVNVDNGYYDIDFTEEDIDKVKKWVCDTIKNIQDKTMIYELLGKDDSIFMQDIEQKDSFYFSNLSGYSSNLHKPYRKYLEDNNLFTNK